MNKDIPAETLCKCGHESRMHEPDPITGCMQFDCFCRVFRPREVIKMKIEVKEIKELNCKFCGANLEGEYHIIAVMPNGPNRVFCDSGHMQDWIGNKPTQKDFMQVIEEGYKENGIDLIRDDMVNHPKHYNLHSSGIECIDVIRHMTHNLGAAVKYIWRAGLKGDHIEDLEKAVFYIKDEIQRLKNEQQTSKNV